MSVPPDHSVPGHPIPETDDALLAECTVDTLRAGTKGGQRANKVETGVRLRHGPTGLVVTSWASRSQWQNKQLALAELRRRLVVLNTPVKPRTATKPTYGSKRRRLDAKRKQGERKATRRRPGLE